jgi:hypothetical protein
LCGGLSIGLSFEIAKHERQRIFLGQSLDFLAQHGLQFFERQVSGIGFGRHLTRLSFGLCPESRLRPELASRAMRHAVQPARQSCRIAESRSFTDQTKEGGLERVLRVVGVAQDAATNAQNEWTVSLDEQRKCGIFLVSKKPGKKLHIAEQAQFLSSCARGVRRQR